MDGTDLPHLATPVPGPESKARVDLLARHECPAITARRARRASALGVAHDDPIVWRDAVGANVRDVDGNVYVDLGSGFGVALVGHRHPDVVAAARAQSTTLLHAMGDAFPDRARIELLERLASHCPPDLEVAILGLSGADAVEAAVKTGLVATGRPGVLTFDGSYHGLSLGTVPLQGYRPAFAEPFRPALNPHVHRLPWAADVDEVRSVLAAHPIGLVLAEPIQGRGGMRPAPRGWLQGVAAAARDAGALIALDEIQTGVCRTGAWWAGPAEGVVPDLMCVGKALGGGFPISACVGTREVMDCWGACTGEAMHTQTFLGHPVGCAAALAVLELAERDDLPGRVRSLGQRLTERLHQCGLRVRGRGLMLGVAVDHSLAVSRALLRRGFLALPAGAGGEVLGLTPPVCLTEAQLEAFVTALREVLEEV